MNETCRFCGTVESVGAPNCLSYKQATEVTDIHPHGCPWFDQQARDRFASPGLGGWMPIETAPQDDTQIIVCGSYTEDVAIVRWDKRQRDWLCLYDDGFVRGSGYICTQAGRDALQALVGQAGSRK